MNRALLEERRELQRRAAELRRSLRLDLEAHGVDRKAWREELGVALQRLGEISEEWEPEQEPLLRTASLALAERFPAFWDDLRAHADGSVPAELFEDHALPVVVACSGCGETLLLLSSIVDEAGHCWCHSCVGDFQSEANALDEKEAER